MVGSIIESDPVAGYFQSEALRSGPEKDDRDAFYNLGVLYLRGKAYDKAATAFENAINLVKDKKDGESLELARIAALGLAVANAKTGKPEAAKAALTRALEFAPW